MSNNFESGFIQYPALNRYDTIRHFTTTRMGGVSTGNYSSFNLGLFSDDNPDDLSQNFKILSTLTNIPEDNIHLPFQTHSNKIFLIDEDFLSKDNETRQAMLQGVDALITNIPNQCIGVSTADCVPVLLYDPVHRAISSVHAGWRGTCSKILSLVISTMKTTFNTNPKDLIAVIGPSISPEVYEVGISLLEKFGDAGFDTRKIFIHKDGKTYLDLWSANKILLRNEGVSEENIEISGICTFVNYENFFSARRLGIHSGRMISGIMLI